MTPLVPVAVVGVGNMGGGILTRLLGLGWSVAVHDIDPQVQSQAVALGAVPCGSAMAAAQILAPDGVLVVVVVPVHQLRPMVVLVAVETMVLAVQAVQVQLIKVVLVVREQLVHLSVLVVAVVLQLSEQTVPHKQPLVLAVTA